MWGKGNTSRIAEADAARFRDRRKELALGPLVIHGNYLINLASPNPVLRTRSVQAFHQEVVRAIALGADYLVIHPGSGREGDRNSAVGAIVAKPPASAARHEARRSENPARKYRGAGHFARLAIRGTESDSRRLPRSGTSAFALIPRTCLPPATIFAARRSRIGSAPDRPAQLDSTAYSCCT